MSKGMNLVVWLIVAVILMLIEGITVQLVSVWFIIGTIPTIIATAFGAPLWLQLIIFLVVSIIVLMFMRPIAKKRLTTIHQPTNADRVIGMTGIVIETIDNIHQTGRISVNGLEWTARTKSNGVVIKPNEEVKVLKIDGVKLIVKPSRGE